MDIMDIHHNTIIDFINIKDFKNLDILFWAPLEPLEYPFVNDLGEVNESKTKFFKDLYSILKNRNLKIFVVSSYTDSSSIIDIYNPLSEYVSIFKWKTSLLHLTRFAYESVYNDSIYNIKFDESDINKLFLNLNRNPKPDRVYMVDSLFKNNLFDIGDVSWNILSEHSDYNFKHWNETIKKIDLNEVVTSGGVVHDFHLFSDKYLLSSKCFINIVSETIVGGSVETDVFISEKTWKPLLLGHPFLCVAPAYFFKYLKSFGFKLYDEIFDYSFDNEMDVYARIDMIIDNLIKLKNKDYNKLYLKIKDKVEYNRNLSISFTEKDPFMEIKLINFYKNHKIEMDKIHLRKYNMNLQKIMNDFL